ncbi:MAG: hypothetical protein ACKOYM_02820, partial [Actinomycetes bacterium]
QTFPWFRYVVPAVVLSGMLAVTVGGSPESMFGRGAGRLIVAALLLPGVIMSWSTVARGALGSADDRRLVQGLSAVIGDRPVRRSDSALWLGQRVASDIDALPGAEPGAVLTDLSSTFSVVAAAKRPELYIVPSDRDFLAVVADPRIFGVRYVLLRSGATAGDAGVRAYPNLWAGTDPLARLVRRWRSGSPALGEFRLFKIIGPQGSPRATPTQELRR